MTRYQIWLPQFSAECFNGQNAWDLRLLYTRPHNRATSAALPAISVCARKSTTQHECIACNAMTHTKDCALPVPRHSGREQVAANQHIEQSTTTIPDLRQAIKGRRAKALCGTISKNSMLQQQAGSAVLGSRMIGHHLGGQVTWESTKSKRWRSGSVARKRRLKRAPLGSRIRHDVTEASPWAGSGGSAAALS